MSNRTLSELMKVTNLLKEQNKLLKKMVFVIKEWMNDDIRQHDERLKYLKKR